MSQTTDDSGEKSEKMGLREILSSVFAAALGVQSSKNRERDFKSGSFGVFIIAGLLFTALFIGGVITVVQLVVPD
ncbi:DUF2970 domain-containing protein [Luminiphilus syltensis]|nr:DUF2970 domain-containing protein [Luminiphilus syltensis]